MNSHGKLFNVDMAWGQNGGTLFTQKLTGNSSTDNNLHQSIAGNMNKYYDNYSERTSGSKTDNYHGVVNNYSGTTENTGNAGGFLALHTDKYDLLNHMRKSVNMDRVWTNQGALKDFQTKVTAGFNALGSKSNDASSAFGFDVSGGIKGTPGIFYGKAGLDYSAQAVDQTRVNEISAKFTNQTNKLFNDVTKTTEQKTQLAAGMIHQYQSELRGMGDQTKVGRVGNTGLGDAEGALRSMGAGKAVDKGKEMLGLTSNTPPNSATREY